MAQSTRSPRAVLKGFLEDEIRDAVPCTEHATRKTVTAKEVVRACVLFEEVYLKSVEK